MIWTGTLTDPAEGITRSVQEALRQMGRPVPEQDKLLSFIGPPLLDSFQEYCGMEREEAEKAILPLPRVFFPAGNLGKPGCIPESPNCCAF